MNFVRIIPFFGVAMLSVCFSSVVFAQEKAATAVHEGSQAAADAVAAPTAEEGAVDDDATAGKEGERPFVDRNGDGINDNMEHRFRKGHGVGRGKGGRSGGASRGSAEGGQFGEGAGNGSPCKGAGTGPDGSGNGNGNGNGPGKGQ